ncbi:cupin domain-containing protein [Nocardia sp. NPDC058640]|uniref:AraC family transcriptional regulator n=1 Tax=Nocardia sp. NPDC058640 TaxID=3346571 RepID=UPI00364F1E47
MDDDVLGSVLAPLRLHGAYYSDWRLHPGWAVRGRPEPRALMHYMFTGSAVVTCQDGLSHTLASGDLAMFPRGAAHIVSGEQCDTAPYISDLLPERLPGASAVLSLGNVAADPVGRMLCAGLDYDPSAAQLLYQLLPDVLIVRARQLAGQQMLQHLLAGILDESDRPGAGAETVQLRAFELAYVLGLRLALATTDTVLGRAIRNPRLAPALVAINTRFGQSWTVPTLAGLTEMSESTFTREFTATVGARPAAYLRARRLLETKRLLADTALPLEQISTAVGYTSTVGLHQAFVRECRVTPGEFRARRRAARADR